MNPSTGNPFVYIVDDEESARKGLSLLLRSAGMACRTFSSAEQFLAEVSPQPGDCVLLDLTMPRMTGLDFLKELNRRKFHPPVIAISARDDAETSSLARQLGARFFLRKPVDDQALIDAIHWVLESDRAEPTKIRHPGSHDSQGA
jgi:FixJ family two-component response regulator